MKRSRLNLYSKAQIPKLKRQLDILFAALMGNRHAYRSCITCTKTQGPFHADHFILRGFMATRWNLFNVSKQCSYDHVFRNGAAYEYVIALETKYVHGAAAELYRGFMPD